MQTTVHLDANEEAILRYENRQYDKEFVKVTINLKDTLAMVKLCESTEQDVLMSSDKDGDPVSLRPTREFAGGHFASSEQQIYGGGNKYPRGGIPQFDFDAEMVLAAMLPDEEEDDDDDDERKTRQFGGLVTIPSLRKHLDLSSRQVKPPKMALFDHLLQFRARITIIISSGTGTTTKKKFRDAAGEEMSKDTSLRD